MLKANKGNLIDLRNLSQANSNFMKSTNHNTHISLSGTKYQFGENLFSRKNVEFLVQFWVSVNVLITFCVHPAKKSKSIFSLGISH